MPMAPLTDQALALDVVARIAMGSKVNLMLGPTADLFMALSPVGVPTDKAIQVVNVVGGYDVWSSNGQHLVAADVSAEVAAEYLVRQYREYKAERIRRKS